MVGPAVVAKDQWELAVVHPLSQDRSEVISINRKGLGCYGKRGLFDFV
ncbi:MAG: hypothetical protein IPJ55_08060 [Chloracidobacterium sp.]|nr:hypothetical protein [Chloracidobacterium sp.]